jgi:hypothetical protein
MTTYNKLKAHLEKHQYKRGRHKGDAPADHHKRGKSHFRVVESHSTMAVRMHNADLLTAYPDGRVEFDTNGYMAYSTTKMRFREAMKFLTFRCLGIGSRKVMGVVQSVLALADKYIPFYDGMVFDAEGNLLTPPVRFEQRRIDKAEVKELMADLKESGFLAAYPVLYAMAEPGDQRMPNFLSTRSLPTRTMHRVFTSSDEAHHWADTIAYFKFDRVYNYNIGQQEVLEIGDAKSCRSRLLTKLKADMYNVTRSDVTEILK